MGKQHRSKQTVAGYVTREIPIIQEGAPIEMSYQDNEDGTVTASFDDIPGAYLTGDTLELCMELLQKITKVIQGKLAEDIRAIKARTDGDMHGALSLDALEQRGIQTRLIDGYYCTRLLGAPNAMFMCQSRNEVGSLFGLLLQAAMAGYRHDMKTLH